MPAPAIYKEETPNQPLQAGKTMGSGGNNSFGNTASAKAAHGKATFAIGAAQCLAYLVVCIALVEVLFYIAQVGDSEHIKPDIKVGFKPFAGKRITQRGEGFGSFRLNSFGMQNDETTPAKPPGVYRIAVFGDSYVEALQVPRSANYVNLVEKELSKRLGKKVEVLNFGVSNYSVAQDYLRYQTVARQFKPDLVIQVFRVEEIGKLLPMETQALLFVRPVFFVGEKGQLVYDNTCVRQFFNTKEGKRMLSTQWFRANSRIWGVMAPKWLQALSLPAQTQALMALPKSAPKQAASIFTLPTDNVRANYAKCYWYMMDKQLSCFKDQCTRDGAAFVFVRTPMIRPGMHVLTDNETETNLLEKTAAKLNVPVLNLDKAYRAYAGTTDDGSNFSAGGHFTKKLHGWVADNLTDFLANRLRQQKTSQAR
jgi:hypothetical protein